MIILQKKNFYEKKIEIKRLKKQIFNTQIYYSKKKNCLSLLCDKFGTDKGFVNLEKEFFYNNYHPHNYSDFLFFII